MPSPTASKEQSQDLEMGRPALESVLLNAVLYYTILHSITITEAQSFSNIIIAARQY